MLQRITLHAHAFWDKYTQRLLETINLLETLKTFNPETCPVQLVTGSLIFPKIVSLFLCIYQFNYETTDIINY